MKPSQTPLWCPPRWAPALTWCISCAFPSEHGVCSSEPPLGAIRAGRPWQQVAATPRRVLPAEPGMQELCGGASSGLRRRKVQLGWG